MILELERRIIIDTSSILFGFASKKDIFQIVEDKFYGSKIAISVGVISELTGISHKRGKNGAIARFALLVLKSKKLKVYNINTNVDNWILRSSKKSDIVVTNDTELSMRLRVKGISVLKLTRSGTLRLFLNPI